jgi:hypothetical protein
LWVTPEELSKLVWESCGKRACVFQAARQLFHTSVNQGISTTVFFLADYGEMK